MRKLTWNQRKALERLRALGQSWAYPSDIADGEKSYAYPRLHEGTARSVLPLLAVKGLCEFLHDGRRTKYRITDAGLAALAKKGG